MNISPRVFAVLLFVLVPALFAEDELNLNPDGIALKGMDPVSYFSGDGPMKGSASFTLNHDGAVYRFTSEKNRELFKAAPVQYLPAYGGWCSYGITQGKKLNIDPDAWVLVDGKLYLQLNLGTQKVWNGNQQRNIEIADRLWPEISKAPASALNE